MKHRKAKRKIASMLALLVCLSAPMQCGAALAEETGEIQALQPQTESVPTAQPEPESEPESEPEPQVTPAAPEDEIPQETENPEETPVPEDIPTQDEIEAPEITPEPEETPDAEETPDPENPGETPSPDDDQTAGPQEEQILRNPYSGWYGVTPTDEQGMPIPILYQTDYPEVICTIRGIERSVQSSGCGATSVSMVIAYLTGNIEQNPYIIFCDAVDRGLYTGEGFTHGMISHYAEEYGLKGKWIGKDGDVIMAALEKGIPIIAHMGPGIFTDRGHYIVLRGVTHDGKILINDPVSPTKTERAFPLQTILTQCKSRTPFMLCWTEEMEAEVESLEHLDEEELTMEEIAIEFRRPIPELPHAVEVTTEMVNLRVRPGKGDVAAHLNLGDKALAVEERIMDSGAFWYGVKYEGETLYLKSEYISPIEASEEELAILQETAIQSAAEIESEPTIEPAPLPEIDIEPEAAVESQPALAPAAEFAPCAAEVTADRVNLRVSPGTGALSKVLRQGAKLYVNQQRFTRSGAVWYGVIFEGQQLYVKGEYIRFVEADEAELEALKEASMQPEAIADPEETVIAAEQTADEPSMQSVVRTLTATMDGKFDGAYIAYIACDSANLRNHIGTNPNESLVVCSVPNGTAMYIIDEELCYEDGYVWCKVLFRGQQLYVRGDLLHI